MPPSGYFLDSNLLVLFVAGAVDRSLIERHRRLRAYSADDFDLLHGLIASVDHVFVTPNTLTEASNLLAQHGEPERTELLQGLRILIHNSEEVVVVSAEASDNSEFSRLGLTDSALLERVSADTPLLTVDVPLYLAAQQNDYDAAVNFFHLRDSLMR